MLLLNVFYFQCLPLSRIKCKCHTEFFGPLSNLEISGILKCVLGILRLKCLNLPPIILNKKSR